MTGLVNQGRQFFHGRYDTIRTILPAQEPLDGQEILSLVGVT